MHFANNKFAQTLIPIIIFIDYLFSNQGGRLFQLDRSLSRNNQKKLLLILTSLFRGMNVPDSCLNFGLSNFVLA